jgi:2-oxoglutarate ferredoxin oxidoreductase subunit gamma
MKFRDLESIEIRFTGTGGQGLVLASIILADALAQEEYSVVTSESHGVEARGGTSVAEMVCSRGDIYDLTVLLPDIFIGIAQKAVDKYFKKIKEDALVIIDSYTVKEIPPFNSKNVYTFPYTQIVRDELKTTLPANIAFLGSLSALSDLVDKKTMKDAVLRRVPERFRDVNAKAFEIGYELAINAQPVTIDNAETVLPDKDITKGKTIPKDVAW